MPTMEDFAFLRIFLSHRNPAGVWANKHSRMKLCMGAYFKLKAILRHTVERSQSGWLHGRKKSCWRRIWLPLHVAISPFPPSFKTKMPSLMWKAQGRSSSTDCILYMQIFAKKVQSLLNICQQRQSEWPDKARWRWTLMANKHLCGTVQA